MKFMPLACSVYIALLFSSPSYADSLTLDEFLSDVSKANPSIQSVQLRAQALENRIDPAGALDDPFIAMGVDEVSFGGGSEHVMRYQISQAIPFPGKLSTKSGIARDRASSAKSDAETLNREVTVIATQAFFRAYYNQKSIELNSKLKRIVSGTVSSTKSRYLTGDEGHHDFLLAKIELSSFDVDKLKLLREQKTLQAVINELRSKPAETPLGSLSVKFSSKDLIEGELPSSTNQPELKSLDFFVTQAEKEEKLAKLAYYPDFVIQGMVMDPSSNMMDASSNWGVMVGVNIPIYAGKKQSKLLSAAKNDKAAALREKRSLENRLNTEFVAAKEQFKTARDVVGLYKNTVMPTTRLAVKNAKSSYAAGRLPLTEYLDTLKVQRTQELEYLAAQIDVELARTRLKELLSAPPVLRLAPTKPSLFGGRSMGGGMSDTVNMGDGMSGPTRKTKASSGSGDSGSSGMGGM
ncbi:MAG: TolC family protein [bacterium]|nr:TolC family protein [bacterium]